MTAGGRPRPGTTFCACLEWLFAAEAPEIGARIRLAASAGFRHVEFWHWSNKDLDAVQAALAETGISLVAILAEPKLPLVDRRCHDAFLAGLADTVSMARRLGVRILIVQAGDTVPGLPRAAQRDALIEGLRQAAAIAGPAGLTLALEPLETVRDRPDYYLSSTREGLDVVDAVGSPHVRLLYDLYHSAMMGEPVVTVLGDRVDRVAHVHLADVPGRGEPGSGAMPWRSHLADLESLGYAGLVGLEYRPTRATADTLRDTMGRQAS